MEKEKTCCFLGHRKIPQENHLRERLYALIEHLIVNESITTFLFGSKSKFNDLCVEVTTDLKEKYPHIKRIYVRAEFPLIDDDYRDYLLSHYEATYFPERIINAGKSVYVERNFEMINNSDICIVYYDADLSSVLSRKSGTEIA